MTTRLSEGEGQPRKGRSAFTLLVVAIVLPGGSAAAAGLSVTKFELAATPPSPAGTACPRSGSKCSNFAAEPAIRADNDGNFYASSENSLLQGADAWKASDGGLHYRTLLSPNQV